MLSRMAKILRVDRLHTVGTGDALRDSEAFFQRSVGLICVEAVRISPKCS
jgi:hypothetical protein